MAPISAQVSPEHLAAGAALAEDAAEEDVTTAWTVPAGLLVEPAQSMR